MDRKQMKTNTIIQGDCLDVMPDIPDGSIDMILCDPPYGTTACKWDSVIPFDLMWEQLNRVIKKNGAIVLFGFQPFSSALIMSNVEMFKYCWVWEKNNAVGFVNAKLKPMNKHEDIIVFSEGKNSNCNLNNMPYSPQGLVKMDKIVKSGNKKTKENTYWRPSLNSSNGIEHIQEWTNYPTSILKFSKDSKPIHPTQKPVALMEYLIRTYTNKGETVLDFTIGSGTTAVAAIQTGRNFIGIEKEQKYVDIARQRITQAQPTLF